MLLRTATFLGKRWSLRWIKPYRAEGICEAPDVRGKQLYVPQEGGTQADLETILHEGLHACGWDILSEEWVTCAARDIARLAWRLGWRKCNCQKLCTELKKHV